ncbi:Uncharacterised protein [Neisseria animalis]|nr:Uncharacterised protein [Neisseria animalis]
MIQRCFALPYYVYCLRLRCLVSFLFYSTIIKFQFKDKYFFSDKGYYFLFFK